MLTCFYLIYVFSDTFWSEFGDLTIKFVCVDVKCKLTDGSCAIPTHVWASQGGNLPFPGFSLAVGTAAGLCSPDLSPSDDTQTWRK